MSTMKEMAAEYRLAAAKLTMQIRRMKAEGRSEIEITPLKAARHEVREIQHLLDTYYEFPRSGPDTVAGWFIAKGRPRSGH